MYSMFLIWLNRLDHHLVLIISVCVCVWAHFCGSISFHYPISTVLSLSGGKHLTPSLATGRTKKIYLCHHCSLMRPNEGRTQAGRSRIQWAKTRGENGEKKRRKAYICCVFLSRFLCSLFLTLLAISHFTHSIVLRFRFFSVSFAHPYLIPISVWYRQRKRELPMAGRRSESHVLWHGSRITSSCSPMFAKDGLSGFVFWPWQVGIAQPVDVCCVLWCRHPVVAWSARVYTSVPTLRPWSSSPTV